MTQKPQTPDLRLTQSIIKKVHSTKVQKAQFYQFYELLS
jgi:hypothetical protein